MLIQSPGEWSSNFTAPVPLHPSPKLAVAASARNVQAFPDLPCERAGVQSQRASLALDGQVASCWGQP